ncbi:hypothetical protein F4780DRAFT_689053 [Xylariomycetidae sp. FL0641]|nr:hypothetical protein F4780DRAFT_689053 [Xylariomycetidae sp. FL0641]
MPSLLARLTRLPVIRFLAVKKATSDIFSSLPVELHLLLLDHLGPEDVAAGLGASPCLRRIWLSDEIWPALADRWFPGLAAQLRSTVTGNEVRAERFAQALHRITRRMSGRFASAVHHRMVLDPERFFQLSKAVPVAEGGVHDYDTVQGLYVEPDQPHARYMMYRHGRIAWWPEGYAVPWFAVVDDFRTRIRRAYVYPDHRGAKSGYKTSMSDKLFIMGCGRTLHAWHLELDRLQTVQVPDHFDRCTTEGETVLIVSRSADVYMWRYGQVLHHLNMTRFGCYTRELTSMSLPDLFDTRRFPLRLGTLYLSSSRMAIDFILSPTEDDVFFVITLHLERPRLLVVYEIRRGELVGKYPFQDGVLSATNTTLSSALRWEKMDSYGGYMLTEMLMESTPSTEESGDDGGYQPSVCPSGHRTDELVSLCFNIYTKSFTVIFNHLPTDYIQANQVWNGQLITIGSEDTWRLTDDPTPLISIDQCADSSERDGKAPTPIYTTVPSKITLIYQRRELQLKTRGLHEGLQTVGFALDPYQQFSSKGTSGSRPERAKPSSDKWQMSLKSDDSFLVFFDAQNYTVWSFGNGIPPRPVLVGEKKSRWRLT